MFLYMHATFFTLIVVLPIVVSVYMCAEQLCVSLQNNANKYLTGTLIHVSGEQSCIAAHNNVKWYQLRLN